MENPRELCVFSLLLTRWNSGCSLLEAGASQMSHDPPVPSTYTAASFPRVMLPHAATLLLLQASATIMVAAHISLTST